MQISRLLRRLRTDFQLSIITLMGFFAVLGISPYAVYRLAEGNYVVGAADVTIVTSTMLAVFYAWRTGDTVKPGIVVCIVFSAAATLIAIKLGVNGLFWIYPLTLFNFFMVSPGKALTATFMMLGTLVFYELGISDTVFESHYQMTSFLVTSLLASLLAFIFASRTRNQRDQLQALTVQDPLTGAGNRRAMNEALHQAGSSQRRQGDSYAVLLMDLDHFKQVNDNYGHQAGDEVLIDFVELIRRYSRKDDRLFRFGGEEFLLLLPNTDQPSLQAVASNLQEQINQHLHGPGGSVSMSSGGATLRRGEHWESLLERADQRLYQAKSAGRNRAIVTS